MIKTFIKVIRKKIISVTKTVIFEKESVVGWNTHFEGMNKLSEKVVFADSSIAFGSYIGEESLILNTSIGRYTSISARVKVITGRHPTEKFVSTHPCFYSLLKQSGFTYAKEPLFEEFIYIDKKKKVSVKIGNDVWIGSDVLIMSGVTIEDGAIIATGSVVTSDIEPYAIYGGIPAKKIRDRFCREEIEFLLALKWWNNGEDWIKRHAYLFSDIKLLMSKLSKD